MKQTLCLPHKSLANLTHWKHCVDIVSNLITGGAHVPVGFSSLKLQTKGNQACLYVKVDYADSIIISLSGKAGFHPVEQIIKMGPR